MALSLAFLSIVNLLVGQVPPGIDELNTTKSLTTILGTSSTAHPLPTLAPSSEIAKSKIPPQVREKREAASTTAPPNAPSSTPLATADFVAEAVGVFSPLLRYIPFEDHLEPLSHHFDQPK